MKSTKTSSSVSDVGQSGTKMSSPSVKSTLLASYCQLKRPIVIGAADAGSDEQATRRSAPARSRRGFCFSMSLHLERRTGFDDVGSRREIERGRCAAVAKRIATGQRDRKSVV